MNINFYTYNPVFTSKSMTMRKEYCQKADTGQLTERNIANIQGLCDRFACEGLTYPQCYNAAKKHPFLFVQKPETLEYNIREVARRFKNEGLTTEKYLKAVLHNPQLFSFSPDTIEKNIHGIVKLFANYGLTTDSYLKCAINNSSLFAIKPETIKKKIFAIAKKLDISTSDLLNMLLKQPTIFNTNEKEFIKKFEILHYIEENKFFDGSAVPPNQQDLTLSILRKKFTNSIESLYALLLRNKISAQLEHGHKLPHTDITASVIKFIKDNKNKIIRFDIPDGKAAKDFIKYAKMLSKSAAGKNIFRITIIK